MKKKLVAALLAATMVLSLAACGGKGDGGSSGGSGGSDGGAPQELHTSLNTEPSTLDTIKGNDMYGWDINKNTLEPLTRLVEKDRKSTRLNSSH